MIRVLMATVVLMLVHTQAGAAENKRMFQTIPAAGCAAPLPGSGKALPLKEPLDAAARDGVMSGLFLTLYDPTGAGRPDADLKAALNCPMAKFAAKDAVWTIYSGSGGAPLRLISTPGRDDTFQLVKGPALSDAAAWGRSRRGLPTATAPANYYLIGVLEPFHYLIKIYDGAPAMETVADEIATVLETDETPIATYETNGGVVNLMWPTELGPRAEIFRPGDLGDGRTATLYYPDDRLVTVGQAGDYVLRGSEFACRPEYGPFKRTRAIVLNPADDGLELGCGLETDTGYTTVYVTHAPETAGDKAYWAEQIRFLEQRTGVAEKISSPRTGPKAMIQAGRMWVDKEGQVQVILFMRRGEYMYELRQTYGEEDIEAAPQALVALAQQIDQPERPVDAWRKSREQP